MTSAFPSYPRPDLDRSARWVSLDGLWDFVPDAKGILTPETLGEAMETIAVPGSWEDTASGGRHDWLETGWYRREVTVPPEWTGERVILTIGAAFLRTDVWFDGVHVGSSDSGYLPLEVAVSARTDGAPSVLTVRVTSPRDKRDVPHGKQRSIPYDDYNGCSFTPTSGIWQSVWIEPRPEVFLTRVHLTPGASLESIDMIVEASEQIDANVTVLLEHTGESVTIPLIAGRAAVSIAIKDARLWSPQDPHLYYVTVSLTTTHGTDTVRAYTGIRSFEAKNGAFFLNGKRTYLRGVLDQGYWPGSGLAAPDEQALITDLELAAAAGFTLVRKHLKAEEPRWLYHADRLGMLVWAEPASTGRFSDSGAAAFERELLGLVERDHNHPAIVIWGAYNEEWGLDWDIEATPNHVEAARRAYRLLREKDPSRPAVDNSGWSHVETDIVDWHYYNEIPGRFADAIERLLRGEPFDIWHSASYPIAKTLGVDGFERVDQPLMNSEYGGGWNSLERAWHSRWQTQYLRLQPTNQGYVYTELYDVENETVGVYTYDRKPKDQDGFRQSWAHADTVIAPLVDPLSYGADLVIAPGVTRTISVMISHHGAETVSGRLSAVRDGEEVFGLAVTIESFEIAGPFDIDITGDEIPKRIHLSINSDGTERAHTFIDVVPVVPSTNLPPDQGWRPEGGAE